MKRLAQFFIIVGIFAYLIGMYQVWLRFNPSKLAFSDYQPVAKPTPFVSKALPTSLVIEDRNIAVSVHPTNVVNNVWETNDKAASYVLSSPLPGEEGNSVIYAHNWANLFGNLPSVKPGDTVEVAYADGTVKIFEIQYTSMVAPNESTILAPSRDKRITLYTCAGWFDEKRFVAIAVLKG